MSDSERNPSPAAFKQGPDGGNGDVNGNGHGDNVVALPTGRRGHRGDDGEPPRPKVRIRKLRVVALLLGLGALAAVSTVFGMMMAVASDLPQLEDPLKGNSVLLDADGK